MRRGAAAGGGTEAETGGEIRTKAEEGQGETRWDYRLFELRDQEGAVRNISGSQWSVGTSLWEPLSEKIAELSWKIVAVMVEEDEVREWVSGTASESSSAVSGWVERLVMDELSVDCCPGGVMAIKAVWIGRIYQAVKCVSCTTTRLVYSCLSVSERNVQSAGARIALSHSNQLTGESQILQDATRGHSCSKTLIEAHFSSPR